MNQNTESDFAQFQLPVEAPCEGSLFELGERARIWLSRRNVQMAAQLDSILLHETIPGVG